MLHAGRSLRSRLTAQLMDEATQVAFCAQASPKWIGQLREHYRGRYIIERKPLRADADQVAAMRLKSILGKAGIRA